MPKVRRGHSPASCIASRDGAAMPAMGMGAQRAAATLAEQSPGAYSGPLQLGSGGAWQVTIAVLRGGQTVTAKQFSVDATGGM